MAKRKRSHVEFQRLVEEARRNEAGTPPRKHHLVPASYLRRWAENGKIRVTVVDEHRTYLATPENAARETDFYRMEHPEVDSELIPPLLFEVMLGKIEDQAKHAIDELLELRTMEALSPERAAYFAWHLAFSITRGKAFRAEQAEIVSEIYRLQYEKITDDGIAAQLRRNGFDPTAEEVARNRVFIDELIAGDVYVAQPDIAAISMAGEMADKLGEHLMFRNWQVYRTPPILVTCDEPVIAIEGPGTPRTERGGVGTAGAIIYPLTPSDLLVLFDPDMQPAGELILSHIETAEINREIIANASRWAFERPTRRGAIGLKVPPSPDKLVLREGPMPLEDGEEGELYRTYKPTRWHNQSHAPAWPVRRWWAGWHGRQFPRLDDMRPGDTVSVPKDKSRSRTFGPPKRRRKRKK